MDRRHKERAIGVEDGRNLTQMLEGIYQLANAAKEISL